MRKVLQVSRELLISIRVGFFMAVRDLRRANVWTTVLIIAIMVLTFLNLVVVSGILVGLIQGSEQAYNERYLGDIVISKPITKPYIERSQSIISYARSLPGVDVISPRYTQPARLEANYKNRTRETDIINSSSGIAAGIDPIAEDKLGHLSKYLIAGTFLEPNDFDEILVGSNMLYKYNPVDSADLPTLKDVDVGSKVRLVMGDVQREVTIKGILRTKVGEIDQRIFMDQAEFRLLVGRTDYNVGEIAIRLKPGVDSLMVKKQILASGAGQTAVVQTWQEAEPKFVQDIKATFATLGNLLSLIGLAVASITIFIVIFVNAITRRRYIGILKGIGINSRAIEISYMIQSVFYALIGMIVGSVLIFGVLVPFIDAHPIDFPFSDGILVATVPGTMLRAAILLVTTLIAGYIPARIVVKQNTLNAILGR